MTDEKKDGLFKKVGKGAVKVGTDSAKGAIKGTVSAAAAGVVKEGIKQATDASGLTDKKESAKGGIEGQLKQKENEVKKKLIKEGIKRSLK